ncbi:binding-protein-dependent transport system inner membrane protein [Leptolyngbya boryana NIES-2135]|jgi:multiple sugar transport system permease protein|uniref:Binding-protein-dependent transport system inner membrane protein n=1 Tax=Leptolyngbya boryana NIES-2135 TaxID=1973484 RepID=A0A1Z4JQ43_LEPBY|nr:MULTISPECIES: carbohydrate ABC transporter permease [Leptolyngbya]BAY58842.1 binding-protein-dependent transport system inner membrane protein [Leptolyngbya boryana NIES-2135]MBD2370416.1 carbohydrate ABC transporter permease [Leptolyngbya sp. FACHB-161]MBD2376905.1 carbohydrate ABC transporter permease [Leptolyngbya sp. FACHB-238]MBD2401272.1 carbohydrate ABC transporter permease [Leptolyngbya sp. FACHB-239]MBD2407823.1 carbohydrate ABC transporter permease [Leptolyngbya sp. FACHB-402]
MKTKWLIWVMYAGLILYAIVTFIPFLWALSASFKPLAEISGSGSNFIPKNFTFENYQQIFSREPLFGRWLLNSAIVAVIVAAFNLLFNSMAGYALARIRFPGNRLFFFLILAVLVVPAQITLLPKFLILKSLGWLNSYQGLIIPTAVNATFIFMMRQFFINFPKELEEAAELDGLNRFETFFQIVLPLAKPALAAQTIFIFMGSWNEFLLPLVVMSNPEMFTLPIGLNAFKGQYITYWNYIMAASMVFTLPALAIYAFFNRYFIQGVTFTGGKS